MSATTVVTEDAVITNEDDPGLIGCSAFSWRAAVIGAVIAAAVSFFLLTLGSGVGLALVTTPKLLHGAAPTFLSAGAIYFFAAQAFGFAVGGHVTGRLIGPVLTNRKEEEFIAGAHGLGVWAIGVVATALMAAVAAFVAEGSAPAALAPYSMTSHSGDLTPAATAYWTDVLFRGAAPQQQASLAGVKFAQAASTTGSDAAPTVPSDQTQPAQQTAPTAGDDESASPSGTTPSTATPPTAPSDIQIAPSGDTTTAAPAATGTPAAGRNVAADKAEAGRILDVGLANAGDVAPDDRAQLATLVSLDTGMTPQAAQRRVDDTLARIRSTEVKTAETARKVASYASLWAAFSLLFGAIVCVMAAVSARWEDDRIRLFGR